MSKFHFIVIYFGNMNMLVFHCSWYAMFVICTLGIYEFGATNVFTNTEN